MQFVGQSSNQVQESNFVSDLRLVQLEKQLNIELKVNTGLNIQFDYLFITNFTMYLLSKGQARC